tara:strand:+ start:935 stop:2803 length:1869 start_codon:yes stop_codon:yes gene_type:complete
MPSLLQARWASPGDIPVAVDFFQRDINIKKDGTYTERVHIVFSLLNDKGREQLALYPIFYNGSSERINIVKAQTSVGDRVYPVSKSNMVDKAIAGSELGFDEVHKVSIAFPKLAVGAKVELIYTREVSEAILPNFASFDLRFGEGALWNHGVVNIQTEIPLYMQVNDPFDVIKTTYTTSEKSLSGFSISLAKSNFTTLTVNEPEGSLLNPTKQTWVDISSLSDWNVFSERMRPGYFDVASQPLPQILQKIFDDAKKVTNEEDQLNKITSDLIKFFHYLGDWRTVKNQFFPRDLKTIVETQTGDCKDFSVMLGAIAKRLGYKISFPLVHRGFDQINIPYTYPLFQSFNHVFVKLISPTGKTYWVDPTNSTSMAGAIFPDIADRPVLIIGGSDKDKYQISPTVNPKNNGLWLDHTIFFNVTPAKHQMLFTVKGQDAAYITGLSLHMSEKSLEEYLFDLLLSEPLKQEDKASIKLPPLDSRVVKDISIQITMQKKQFFKKTNLGPGISLEYNSLEKILNDTEGQVNDLSLGIPKTLVRKTRLKNYLIPNGKTFDVSIDNQYLSIKRTFIHEGADSVILDELIVKKAFIPSSIMQSPEINVFRKEVRENILDSIYVLDGLDYSKIN